MQLISPFTTSRVAHDRIMPSASGVLTADVFQQLPLLPVRIQDMRLIHLYSYEFREFHRWDIPQYAILSHCWSDYEISYSSFSRIWASLVDVRHRIDRLIGARRAGGDSGYEKIVAFCQIARSTPARAWSETALEYREVQLEWGWIDTCCIDVRSSAELSEGIQSMYPFYEFSTVCYAYIADVPRVDTADSESFQTSRYFKRGWTLQELLAPWDVVFCNQRWEVIGHKCTHRKDQDGRCKLLEDLQPRLGPEINREISQASGIAARYLETPGAPLEASIACRMSWAARRETKRIEDIAYCLLGIFDVNLPMLYGEGRKAFWRLQQEIMLVSNDPSIFAWDKPRDGTGESVFATGPSDFSGCRNVRWLKGGSNAEFIMAKRDLEYHGPAAKWNDQTFVLRLNCCFQDGSPIEIAVSNATTFDGAQLSRVCCDAEPDEESRGTTRKLVEKKFPSSLRQQEKIEMLLLKAYGSLVGAREIRHLCHDISDMPAINDLASRSMGANVPIMEGLDLEEIEWSAAWKHIAPFFHVGAESPSIVDDGSAESSDRQNPKLMKARRLAIAAVIQARRIGNNT